MIHTRVPITDGFGTKEECAPISIGRVIEPVGCASGMKTIRVWVVRAHFALL